MQWTCQRFCISRYSIHLFKDSRSWSRTLHLAKLGPSERLQFQGAESEQDKQRKYHMCLIAQVEGQRGVETTIKKVNGTINMRIITRLSAKQNLIGLIDNSDVWQISVPRLLQALSIDDTTDHCIGCGGAVMASHKAKPSALGKKPKAKTSKPSKPAKAYRSTEYIEDSDDEATNVAKNKQTPKKTPSVPSSTKLKKPKTVTFSTEPSKKRKSPSPAPEKEESVQSDTEAEESSQSGNSSDSEESSSDQYASPTPAKPKGSAPRPATNSAAVKHLGVKPQLNKPKDPGESSNRISVSPRTASPSETEEASVSSEGGKESESESESSAQASRDVSREESSIQESETPTQEHVIYEPPPGFEPASIVVHPSSQVMSIFSPTNLAGKEIWHITAPSSVPISTINELSQQKIESRSSILSYKGSNYGLIPDSSTNEALLLPSAENDEYKSHNAVTFQSFHLQQIVSLPYHAISPAKPSSPSVLPPQAHKRPPREQPKGLKMRYQPFGVVELYDGNLPRGEGPKVPQFRVPSAVEDTPLKKRKRHSTDHEAQSPTISSSKVKSKKAKVRQETTPGKPEDVMDIDTVDQPASQKQDASRPKTNGISENHTPKTAKSKKTKPKTLDKKPDHTPPQPSASQSLLPADIAEQASIIMPEEIVTTGASAVEITASEAKTTKRKRRKEEAARSIEKQQNVAKNADEDVEMRNAEPESPSREPEGQSTATGKSSPQKGDSATNGEQDEIQETPLKKASVMNGEEYEGRAERKETKEERRKRKEERRKRKGEAEAGKV